MADLQRPDLTWMPIPCCLPQLREQRWQPSGLVGYAAAAYATSMQPLCGSSRLCTWICCTLACLISRPAPSLLLLCILPASRAHSLPNQCSMLCPAGCCLRPGTAAGAPQPTASGQTPSKLPHAPCCWRPTGQAAAAAHPQAKTGAQPATSGTRRQPRRVVASRRGARWARCPLSCCCALSRRPQSRCLTGCEV